MNKTDHLSDFNGKFTKLSKLIKSWNLISVTSNSEFDRLTQKILSNLYEGQTEIRIKRIIESELCVSYGLLKTEFNSSQLTKEIMTWWNK